MERDVGSTNSPVICQSAAGITEQFDRTVCSLSKNPRERDEYLIECIEGANEILGIVSLTYIRTNGRKDLCDRIEVLAAREGRATVFLNILFVLAALDGERGFAICADLLSEHADSNRRLAGLIALEAIPSNDATRLLRDVLHEDDDEEFRQEAAIRLAYRGLVDGVPELLKMAPHSDFQKRLRALCALCVIRHNVGLVLTRELLAECDKLSQLERSAMMCSLLGLLDAVGASGDLDYSASPDRAAREIAEVAGSWIQGQLDES